MIGGAHGDQFPVATALGAFHVNVLGTAARARERPKHELKPGQRAGNCTGARLARLFIEGPR